MATDFIKIATRDGGDMNAFANLVELRKKELGSTTCQTCIALIINTLKSLRSDTRVASTRADVSVEVADSEYVFGWKREGGRNIKALRQGGPDGKSVATNKVIWLTPEKLRKNQVVHIYNVTDNVGDGYVRKYVAVAVSENVVTRWAKKRHKEIVMHHRGLAKTALGIAMHEVHNVEQVSSDATAEVKKIANNCVDVKVQEQGFSDGFVHIDVHNKLDYASLALKHGAEYVDQAIQKAMNKMMGYMVSRLHSKGIYDNMSIPYKELSQAGAMAA